MRTFYIVLPALSLLNMGVNGAIIANTLSSRRDGNTVGSGPYSIRGASRQARQFHSADFRSDASPENESSHDTPSGVVSRQTSGDLTVSNAGGDPLELLAPRGLQPTMRFVRRGSIESIVTTVNDKVADTSKGVWPDSKFALGTPTTGDTDNTLKSTVSNLGLRSAFGDEPCNEDVKDARDIVVSTEGSGTDIGLTYGHEVTPRGLPTSIGKVTPAVRRAPTVATSIGSAADAVPAASSAAVAQGTQTLGSLPVRRAVDFATFHDDIRTTSSESRKVTQRQDSNSITDADVATLGTAIDNAVATGDAAEARRSLVVGHESRALPALPVPLPVNTPNLPVDPTTVTDALPVKRRFRRQDDASDDAAADSDAAVEVDTTTNSAADTEADTTANVASGVTSDDGASLDELD